MWVTGQLFPFRETALKRFSLILKALYFSLLLKESINIFLFQIIFWNPWKPECNVIALENRLSKPIHHNIPSSPRVDKWLSIPGQSVYVDQWSGLGGLLKSCIMRHNYSQHGNCHNSSICIVHKINYKVIIQIFTRWKCTNDRLTVIILTQQPSTSR